ncbi:SDR family NAD(P)-dependent oxidoreductase [Novosphingobium sp. AAP93]|uniref:SDR family NAD(P)-dependent oxidoreductase n=1 Tax=Novosphingobium sp. AAP93 TaxID=1523427 RepID=UPI0006B9E203|nr:SDR family oxidoreductase [Novosphingobium sp. AAP93]KPF80623.1 3-oxoacyl-ACP reductase [Novosphingobium sp. AAP93]
MTDTTGAAPLLGRTALITGSSSGIGAGVALAFTRAGAAFVIINYPHEAEAVAAEAVAEEVRSLGAKALAVQADVSDEGQVTALVAAALEAAGRIDILVNNAGIGHGDTVEDLPIATWDRVIGIHLRGTFLMTHAVLPGMYAAGFGRIINTASQLAYKGAPGLSAYTAAKGGIISFTRSLALEIGSRDVRVNCVAPGATRTPILDAVPADVLEAIRAGIPIGHLADVADIVPSYVFLASEAGRHFQGQVLSPNGGDHFL